MKKSGFTLIEILVVIGIFGVIAGIGVNMFFSIMKGSAKTRVLAEVKQNGSYAINVMERMIRNARKIEGQCQPAGSTSDSIRIVNPDEGKTTFACLDIGTSEGRIASRSGMGAGAEYKRLTNDKVKVDSCSFFCQGGEEGVSPDKVTIEFTLSQAGTAVRPEEEATVGFKTAVTLRNY